MKISATRLQTYLDCPRKYRYLYVECLPRPFSPPLVFGGAIHAAIQTFEQDWMANGFPPDVETAVQGFRREWATFLEQEEFPASTGEENYLALGALILQSYLSDRRRGLPPLVAEFAFEIPFGEHSLTGVIDRIDESEAGLVLVEFKTSKRRASEKELKENLQLTFYAFALQQVFEPPLAGIQLCHLRSLCLLATERTEADFALLTERLLPETIQGIQNERFPPCIGWKCRFCEFRDLCTAEGAGEQFNLPPVALSKAA